MIFFQLLKAAIKALLAKVFFGPIRNLFVLSMAQTVETKFYNISIVVVQSDELINALDFLLLLSLIEMKKCTLMRSMNSKRPRRPTADSASTPITE